MECGNYLWGRRDSKMARNGGLHGPILVGSGSGISVGERMRQGGMKGDCDAFD
jgi:hypothetical protein